jgi:D-alanine--poly(phosphoribitol) ligase subunit 1
MRPLAERIIANADPGRVAVDSPNGVISYAELVDRARRLAARLGARRGPVLLYGHKQPAMVVGILAALHAGRPYVPVDPSVPPARVGHILELARPADAVLAQEPPAAPATELQARGIPTVALDPLAADLDGSSAPAGAPRAISPEDEAYILFTSGTTGPPKGVRIPYRGLAHFGDWLLESQGFALRGETFLNQAPFNFDLSVMDLYGALLSGGTLFCITQEEIGDPRKLFARLDGAPLTIWVSTPSFARFCLAEPRFGAGMLPRLRKFLFCGETLPAPVAHGLYRRFPESEVWNTYGPTETTVAVTGFPISPMEAASDAPLTIGRAFPDMDVWIGDPRAPARRLPDGERGEIVIAGPQVALGYLLAPGASGAEAFFRLADGRQAYRTGDQGHVGPGDGLFYWDARLDRQVKLHGYRVELGEIEAAIARHSGVTQAVVIAIAGDTGDSVELVGFYTGAAVPERQFVRWLRDFLPIHMVPRKLLHLTELPLNANGKIDRAALRASAAPDLSEHH